MEDNKNVYGEKKFQFIWCFGFQGSIKVRCSTFFRSSYLTRISLAFGFTESNIGVWKQLKFVKQNVPSNATSAFSCCYQMIIFVERWEAAILKSITHLSKAFPAKPVYRQFKLLSSSRTSAKTQTPIFARNKLLIMSTVEFTEFPWTVFARGLPKLKICSYCMDVTIKWQVENIVSGKLQKIEFSFYCYLIVTCNIPLRILGKKINFEWMCLTLLVSFLDSYENVIFKKKTKRHYFMDTRYSRSTPRTLRSLCKWNQIKNYGDLDHLLPVWRVTTCLRGPMGGFH